MIRRYHPIDDYAEVLAVYKSSFGPEFTESLLRQRITQNAWVYEVNGQVVGYVFTEILEGEAYLTQVAVLKDYRKAGIATELITRAENYNAPYHDVMWLQVQVDNPSQKLYFDLGYRVTRFEKEVYGPGKDGIRMSKNL